MPQKRTEILKHLLALYIHIINQNRQLGLRSVGMWNAVYVVTLALVPDDHLCCCQPGPDVLTL